MRLLEIDVPEDLVLRWRRYLAPEWQPFFVSPDDGFASSELQPMSTLSDDLRCTYTAWRIRGATAIAWFDEASFMALPRSERTRLVRSQAARGRGAVPSVRRWRNDFDVDRLSAQADGHRFVWWPSLLDENPEPVIRARVDDGQLTSRHLEVSAATWRRCACILPNAKDIVGVFPESSGANCFGTTLAAAGLGDAGGRAVHDGFESFLARWCAPGGRDDEPGTVLVWRDRDGLAFHSAVTIGEGWGIEKAAETWWTPTIVADVADLKRVNRSPGHRLERHRVVAD